MMRELRSSNYSGFRDTLPVKVFNQFEINVASVIVGATGSQYKSTYCAC